MRASRDQKHGVWNILVVHRYECRCVYMHAVREFGLVACAAHTVGLQHTQNLACTDIGAGHTPVGKHDTERGHTNGPVSVPPLQMRHSVSSSSETTPRHSKVATLTSAGRGLPTLSSTVSSSGRGLLTEATLLLLLSILVIHLCSTYALGLCLSIITQDVSRASMAGEKKTK